MRRKKLTAKTIAALPKVTDPNGRGRGRRFYDGALRGFGCEKFPSDRIAFFLEYTLAGSQRRMRVGDYGPLTPEQARRKAERILAKVQDGHDPLAEKARQSAVPTFREYSDRYMADVERRKKDPRHDRRYLTRTADGWGDKRAGWSGKRLDSITRSDVLRMRSRIVDQVQQSRKDDKAGHTAANRWLASIRSCLKAAVDEGIIERNPAADIGPYRENPPRDCTLSRAQETRVRAAVAKEADPHLRVAFLMLLETGARKSEVLRARWDDFDFEAGMWRIPSPKAGRPQVVPLPSSVALALRTLPRLGVYVIPGRSPDQPRADLKRPWDRIRARAKVPDVRVHDLRRTFGLRIAARDGLYKASKLLRHSDIRVTEKVYAPLEFEELRAATERHAADAMRLRQTKKVSNG